MAMYKRYKTIINSYVLPAAIAAAALSAPVHATAKTSYQLNDTARIGFNAIDYVLQKPLGSPVFEHKTFGDHLFISGGVGMSTSGGDRPAAHGEVSLGDWISPVHGWRLSANAGLYDVKEGYRYVGYGGVSLDYLMNLTTLLRGYDPDRKFELIGGLGAEYQRLYSNGSWGNRAGVRGSLQARFNVGSSLFLYVEPQLKLTAGTRYRGIYDNFRRFRPEVGLNVGLGYRLLQGAARREGASEFYNIDDSHIFFGAGGGVASFIRGGNRNTISPVGEVYVGKWLSSAAGLRLKAQFGDYKITSKKDNSHYIAAGSLDYVWNLATAFGGYRPNEVMGINLNMGVAAAYADDAKMKVYPGLEAGLTATFRLSRNWSLFIEPQLQLYTRNFAGDIGKGHCLSPIGSVMAGIQYTYGNFAHDFAESYDIYNRSNKYFLTLSGAPSIRFRGDYGTGTYLSAGFGKRFTPISSWRITADGEYFNSYPKYLSMALSADYLFSISTAMAGFNPDRVFDLSGVIGVEGGAVHHGQSIKATGGGKFGLHGAFRLADNLELFVEPQFVALRNSSVYSTGWTPGMRFKVGLTYRLGSNSSAGSSNNAESPLEGKRNFLSLAGSPTLCIGNLSNIKVNGAVGVDLGHWFTNVSGARLGYIYDFIPARNVPRNRLNLHSFRADYLLNITTLGTHDTSRRFHIIGIVGGGMAFSDVKSSLKGAMLEGGLQFRYNLPYDIDIHLEPNASFYMNRIAQNYATDARFFTVGRITAGVSLRF
jgi:hypothetical protein